MSVEYFAPWPRCLATGAHFPMFRLSTNYYQVNDQHYFIRLEMLCKRLLFTNYFLARFALLWICFILDTLIYSKTDVYYTIRSWLFYNPQRYEKCIGLYQNMYEQVHLLESMRMCIWGKLIWTMIRCLWWQSAFWGVLFPSGTSHWYSY